MSIKFKINITDITNILVTKGANFISTFFIFSLMSRGLSSENFANFGYWWSIGVMLGSVALGGLATALIREVSENKSLIYIKHIILKVLATLTVLVVLFYISTRNINPNNTYYLLFICFLFGVSLQLQISVLSLLRAIKASKANLIASLILVIFVPLCFYLISNKKMAIDRLLINVVITYSLCLALILFSTRKIVLGLFNKKSKNINTNKKFYSNIGSFSLLTIYVSVILIVDASIFKYNADPSDFNIIATSKIYFERFILPLLLVFSGALSIMVLRYDGDHPAILEIHLTSKKVLLFIIATGVIAAGYYLYLFTYSNQLTPLPIPVVIFITTGYLLYVLNGVLLDVLVIKKRIPTVFFYVSSLLIIYIIGQFIIIPKFGILGWSIFWLLFHLFASTTLIICGCGTTKQHNFT